MQDTKLVLDAIASAKSRRLNVKLILDNDHVLKINLVAIVEAGATMVFVRTRSRTLMVEPSHIREIRESVPFRELHLLANVGTNWKALSRARSTLIVVALALLGLFTIVLALSFPLFYPGAVGHPLRQLGVAGFGLVVFLVAILLWRIRAK